MPKFGSALPKLTQSQLTSLESQFGFAKLPPEYRRWILRHNGGAPSPSHFDWEHPIDGNTVREVSTLLGFDTSALVSSNRQPDLITMTLRYRDQLPRSAIVIGFVEPEDVLVLHTRGELAGQVSLLLWDKATRGEDSVFLVASSFRAFLQSLRRAPDLTEPA